MKNSQKYINNLTRLLTNPIFGINFYPIWFLIVFIAFVVFGIFPLSNNILQKFGTLKEMKEVNKGLDRKNISIQTEYEKTKPYDKEIMMLNNYLPEDFRVTNYVVELSFASGASGYKLETVKAHNEGDLENIYFIDAKFTGEGMLSELVKSIESMERIARIDTFSFTDSSTKTDVMVKLGVVTMEEK